MTAPSSIPPLSRPSRPGRWRWSRSRRRCRCPDNCSPRRRQPRRPARAGRSRLHQRDPGLSLQRKGALPPLCRAGAGQRHRAGARRATDRGVGRRHGALGDRRHHQRGRGGAAGPCPGQAVRAGAPDQPDHHHRPPLLSPPTGEHRPHQHGGDLLDLSAGDPARAATAQRRSRGGGPGRRWSRPRVVALPLRHFRRQSALAAAARLRRRGQGLYRVPRPA